MYFHESTVYDNGHILRFFCFSQKVFGILHETVTPICLSVSYLHDCNYYVLLNMQITRSTRHRY